MPALLLETLLMAGVALLVWLGVGSAVSGVLDKGASLSGPEVRTAAEVQAVALRAYLYFLGGMVALLLGRVVSQRRGTNNIFSPFLLPALCAAAGMGLALQVGYGDPLHRPFWPGAQFAEGFAIGGLVGGLVLLLRKDPAELTEKVQVVLPVLMVMVFIALALFGSGTEDAEDTLINLGGVQPVEIVKLAFVVFLAHYFGLRAAKLRHQRDRLFGLEFPRRRLLWPAMIVLVALFGAFILVNDLGPTLILSLVFMTLFYVVTRAGGWVVVAVLVVSGLVALAAYVPAIAQSPKVILRMQMWLNPWTNGLPFGDQTALARWAIAAGYVRGQGLGYAPPLALPAGHTDLAMAHLAEELGAIGLCIYIGLLGVVAGAGLWIAAQNRTPERILLATGLAVLLVAQWLVIFAGTTGFLPLTGVVAPYLSFGKSSMVVFVVLGAALARLAESGTARELTVELAEVRKGSLLAMAVAALVLLGGMVVAVTQGIIKGPATSVRGCITVLAPEPGATARRPSLRHDPRLESIARQIRRGHILDRRGEIIAGSTMEGERQYPLGDAMGTLLGPARPIVLRPLWMLERLLEGRLRGYPEKEDGPSVWVAKQPDGSEELLLIVDTHAERPEDQAVAEAKAAGRTFRMLPLPAPDFRPLLPILHAGGARRDDALLKVAEDVGSRSVKITVDARLQKAASEILKRAAVKGKAGAAVVVDVATGQVLARAQVPDFDPSDPAVLERFREPERLYEDKKFTGIYGAWPDKTGFRGIFQGGSAAKVYTSLVAARQGVLQNGDAACPLRVPPIFPCVYRDALGPLFTRPGWYKAVHDHPEDHMHGQVDFTHALEVSCNVYFGQLGLELGPEPFEKLRADGVEMGWPGWYDPGKKGSRDLALTAFGQHGAMMSVSQAVRIVAAVGAGGVYRKCPPSMELDATCQEIQVLHDPSATIPILSGLQKVMLSGTGRNVNTGVPPTLRAYGKTGTADSIGIEEELPWGVVKGVYGAPHSWFVAMGEPMTAPPCAPVAAKRIAVAVVIPRGGKGAVAAGPAAAEILAAAHALGYAK
jgi:cell division protein FtsW (lipid II flippase)